CRGGKQFGTEQEQQCSFFLVHSLQVDAVGESACRMSASGQEDMPVTPGRQKIKYQVKVIGVIENQQAARVVNQPLLNGSNDKVLILLILLRQVQESGQRHDDG